jgi:hypothetical protein
MMLKSAFRMPLKVSVLAVALAATGTGCAEPNSLTGSIDQSHDLTFDQTVLTFLTGQAAYELKYLLALEGGSGDDVVAKIVFDAPAGGISAGDELDLLSLNGKVERITAANDPFPASLDKGVLTFTAAGSAEGDQNTGEFATTFDNGKTLNGTFDVELTVVDF